jgi:hypothetical protein
MRTTLTLEPDVENLLREAMYRQGKSMKQTLNEAVRQGLMPAQGKAKTPVFKFPALPMGRPLIDLTKANALAGELEDQALIAKLARGA